MWPQLELIDGILCRQYVLGPGFDPVTVCILHAALHLQVFRSKHNVPQVGHQGCRNDFEAIASGGVLGQHGTHDTERYSRECSKCQEAKLPMPQ